MAAEFRGMIEEYLEIRDIMEAVKAEHFNKNLSREKIISLTKDDYFMKLVRLEDGFVKKYIKYHEEKLKYETAIYDYMNGKETVMKIANKYGLSYGNLTREISLYKCLEEKYEFDRHVITRKFSFTFHEEERILKFLKNLTVDKKLQPCPCKACILERLSIFVYNFAKDNDKNYPIDWEPFKRADLIWLQEFELRHHIEISSYCIRSCILYKVP